MKWILLFALCMGVGAEFALAQSPSDAVAAQVAASASPTSAPVAAPAAVAPPVPTVAVQAPAAPPEFVQELLTTVSNLPVVGPYVSKILMYLNILGGILTALVVFLLAVSASLKSAFNWAGLDAMVTWIQNFQQSKIMFWITSISNIPVHKTPAAVGAPPVQPAASAQS